MPKKPKLTKRMTMHMSGGDFFELHYEVFADGKPTEITQLCRTNGRPEYLLTHDLWRFRDEEFDALEARNVGLLDWLYARLPQKKGGE